MISGQFNTQFSGIHTWVAKDSKEQVELSDKMDPQKNKLPLQRRFVLSPDEVTLIQETAEKNLNRPEGIRAQGFTFENNIYFLDLYERFNKDRFAFYQLGHEPAQHQKGEIKAWNFLMRKAGLNKYFLPNPELSPSVEN